MRVERTTNKESAHRVNSGEENSPAAPARIQTHNLSTTSMALLPTSYPRSQDLYLMFDIQSTMVSHRGVKQILQITGANLINQLFMTHVTSCL